MAHYAGLLNVSNFIALDGYNEPTETSLEGLEVLKKDVEADSADLNTYLSTATYCKNLLLSTDPSKTLSLSQILELLQLRLSLLLVSVGLSDSHGRIPIINASSLKSEADTFVRELLRLHDDKMPKEASLDFQVLANRIRYGSGMSLLNFYFKQIPILRGQLKEAPKESSNGIRRFLFSICAVLVARKEYMSLFSQARSVLGQLDEKDSRFVSMLGVLAAVTGVLMAVKEYKTANFEASAYYDDIAEAYTKSKLDPYALSTLHSVIKDYTSGGDPVEDIEGLDEIVRLVLAGQITDRTVYCLCAKFELNYVADTGLWSRHVNNMYALE